MHLFSPGCVVLNKIVFQNNSKDRNRVVLNPDLETYVDRLVEKYILIYSNIAIRSLLCASDRTHLGSTNMICNKIIVPEDPTFKVRETIK